MLHLFFKVFFAYDKNLCMHMTFLIHCNAEIKLLGCCQSITLVDFNAKLPTCIEKTCWHLSCYFSIFYQIFFSIYFNIYNTISFFSN